MIRRAFGLMFVAAALCGVFEPDAIEASEAIARQYAARPGFDPYRDRAPTDCLALGSTWVAHSADANPWWHTCLNVPAASREVSSWK